MSLMSKYTFQVFVPLNFAYNVFHKKVLNKSEEY